MNKILTVFLAFILTGIVSIAPAQQASAQDNPGGAQLGNEVGDYIGDFKAKGPMGDSLQLSDLRGDLVMVVLWNSLCGHCNQTNKKFLPIYEKYHDKEFVNGKHFEIYQIALDKEEATWHEALEKDNFPWKHHVYVIDSWKDKNIRFFGVKNLPGTFLIDENGIILQKDFTPEELEQYLEKYVKN